MRVRPIKTFAVTPALPEVLGPLARLARNLFWSWNTDAAALFERIDHEAWESSAHNALYVLQQCPPARLAELAHDDGFLDHLRRATQRFAAYLERPPQVIVPGTDEQSVIAYFSLEFALTESLPNYSGGLGVLAGDHLKSSSDLGLPLVGVGLLYHEGYFTQELGPDGWQREEYHDIDLASQPLQRLTAADGSSLQASVTIEGREVKVALWQLSVGKTPLILLDTDVDGNSEADREISGRLYGGDSNLRIQQEMVLGIGGVRALWALGMRPAVCHMNEGHSALLAPERIRLLMNETGVSFEEARLPVAAATVFTTHTPVAAGIDLFAPDLIEHHLGDYYREMGLDARTFIGLGRMNPDDPNEPFSMALLGLRLSGRRNGVSQLHGRVSRRLWADAWPELPEEEAPIGAITNGVHLPTWVAHEMGALYDRSAGPEWREDPEREDAWRRVRELPDEELWRVHEEQRRQLVRRAREQHEANAARNGLATSEIAGLRVLDPGILTIGFARRFAGYKRATLLFRDMERLAAIINNAERPVQIIFAGKAHPRDEGAKQLIREVQQMSERPEFLGRVVLLDRYDVGLARVLVQGCDAWLNTPLRPLEASGTSGMKAVANGALHVSVRDGWWWEAYRDGLGWAIGRARLDDSPEVQDLFDAGSLYDLLEDEIIPMFYARDEDGIPREWVRRMKESIAAFAPQFNTSRMVREYAETEYAPAAASWHRLTSGRLQPARALAAWLRTVDEGWSSVRVYSVEDDALPEVSAGQPIKVRVRAHPGALSPQDLCVEVVQGTVATGGTLETPVATALGLISCDEAGSCLFAGSFTPASAGRAGYTIRVLPQHPDLPDALSTGLVHWA